MCLNSRTQKAKFETVFAVGERSFCLVLTIKTFHMLKKRRKTMKDAKNLKHNTSPLTLFCPSCLVEWCATHYSSI